jgi:hypothetical protein
VGLFMRVPPFASRQLLNPLLEEAIIVRVYGGLQGITVTCDSQNLLTPMVETQVPSNPQSTSHRVFARNKVNIVNGAT